MMEPSLCIARSDGGQCLRKGLVKLFKGSRLDPAQVLFEFGPGLLDRVEVR